MADLTPQAWAPGFTPTFDPAGASGDTFENDSDARTFAWIVNSDGVSHTVTIAEAHDCEFGHAAENGSPIDRVENLPPGLTPVGPFNDRRFNANGRVGLTYDDETLLTIAIIRYPSRG